MKRKKRGKGGFHRFYFLVEKGGGEKESFGVDADYKKKKIKLQRRRATRKLDRTVKKKKKESVVVLFQEPLIQFLLLVVWSE